MKRTESTASHAASKAITVSQDFCMDGAWKTPLLLRDEVPIPLPSTTRGLLPWRRFHRTRYNSNHVRWPAALGLNLRHAKTKADAGGGMTNKGQTRLFDKVDAMSAAPPIAAECCTAVSGASGQRRHSGPGRPSRFPCAGSALD
jgi:hypothetical protein